MDEEIPVGVIVEVHRAVEHIRRGYEALLERISLSPHVGQTIRIVGTRLNDGRLRPDRAQVRRPLCRKVLVTDGQEQDVRLI
jgi:hypothetical protein